MVGRPEPAADRRARRDRAPRLRLRGVDRRGLRAQPGARLPARDASVRGRRDRDRAGDPRLLAVDRPGLRLRPGGRRPGRARDRAAALARRRADAVRGARARGGARLAPVRSRRGGTPSRPRRGRRLRGRAGPGGGHLALRRSSERPDRRACGPGRRPLDPAQPRAGLPPGRPRRALRGRELRPRVRARPARGAWRPAARLAHAAHRRAVDRVRAHGPGRRARHRRRRRPRHRERAHPGAAGRRDRVERRDPPHGRRGPRSLVGLALFAARRGHRDRRRPLHPRPPRPELRPGPHRLHGHLERQLGPGLRADREQPLHARGVRRVPRPPPAGRRAQRVAPAARARRRGAQGDRPDAGGAPPARHRPPRAERGGGARQRHLRRALRHGARAARALDSRGARRDRAPRARARGGSGVRAGGPEPARMGTARGREQPARVLRGLAPRRLPAHRRPPVLLQHDAPRVSGRYHPAGLRDLGGPLLRAADHARHPGGPVRGRAGRAARPRAARGAAAALLAVLLRGDRARLPRARGRADPALRPVPRIPDLRALDSALRAPAVHRPGLARVNAAGRAEARAHHGPRPRGRA